MTNPLLDAALAWHAAGAAVLPVRTDGTKAPAVAWKRYMTHPPTLDEVIDWFGTGATDGLGLLMGAPSGNMEMAELEGRAVQAGALDRLVDLAIDHDAGDLLDRVRDGYQETTPSGGIHLLYRVTDGLARRNTKLARDTAGQVLAETRGEGGFVVIAPSTGRTHPSGQPWQLLSGGPTTVAGITADERDLLWAVIALLDEEPARPRDPGPATWQAAGAIPGTRPGDDYAQRTTWADILEPHGWTVARRMGAGYAWTRPGKSHGISATTGQAADGVDRLYVFSSSTPFDAERPYTKFGAYALLEHAGDHAAAAKALAASGYGKPATVATAAAAQQDQTAGTVATVTEAPAATLLLSMDGYSQQLIAEYGRDLRYCPEMGRWLAWDGWRWAVQPGGGGIAREYAKAIARAMPDEPGWSSHKKRALSATGIRDCLWLSESDHRVTVGIDELDAHPWELNTPAGIVDLRTGDLRPADPKRLHTKSTTAAPDPTADGSPWQAFLDTTFQGDTELIGFVQRLLGYACVGEVREAILPVLHGIGANGKTVLLETVAALLGDYATSAPPKFLVQGPTQHATEIAALAGKRLVIASETNEGERFDEAKVKLLTGGDRIKARFMRQDEFTFRPSHLLVLMTNHRPQVATGGAAFWRRVREVPFAHQVPEGQRDPGLGKRLVEQHGAAIMAWLVQGAALYARDGLAEPASVKVATQDYEASTDTVARFVDDMVILGGGEHVRTRTSLVRDAYEAWCKAEGETPVSSKAFTTQLVAKHGIANVKGGKGIRYFAGMTLASATRDDDGSDGSDPWAA